MKQEISHKQTLFVAQLPVPAQCLYLFQVINMLNIRNSVNAKCSKCKVSLWKNFCIMQFVFQSLKKQELRF